MVCLLAWAASAWSRGPDPEHQVFVVPNFHPASCGWLTNFSRERNYCANSYLDHLARVDADPNHAVVLSEVNNLIAIRNFRPERFAALRRRLAEGRVEAVNAFFLEPTICLSGGEALVKQGVEGIRWQRAVLGHVPRQIWTIDATGMHEQMAQICAGLGLDCFVHCRNNPTGSALYWAESPDGSRVLAVSSGHYNIWTPVFRTETPLADAALTPLVAQVRARRHQAHASRVTEITTPPGLPFLVLAGSGDYSLAPRCAEYPATFLRQWRRVAPDLDLRWATFQDYRRVVDPLVRGGTVTLPVARAGWDFSYRAFWIQNPRVKRRFRDAEHGLAAAETLATIASLRAGVTYPSQSLYHAWLLTLLNMDRNTLWGAAGGMVFEDPNSWDVRDRFDWVDRHAEAICQRAVASLRGPGRALTLFNPANWERCDPVALRLGPGRGLRDVATQDLGDGRVLCQPTLPGLSLTGLETTAAAPTPARSIPLPAAVETADYTAVVDPRSGDLVSLRLKPSGREILGGAANRLVAEVPRARVGPGDHMLNRPQRREVGAGPADGAAITVRTGPLATVVTVRAPFYGGHPAERVMTFYHRHPRIDFTTTLEDIPDPTVVLAEFPLARDVTEVRRGIPYGFAHGAWPSPTPAAGGTMQGITPAVRWSAYTLGPTATVALLDRGLTGREINGRTPVIYLLNTTATYHGYPNAWLSGAGRHRLQYALVATEQSWEGARIPRQAWAYNAPVRAVARTQAGTPLTPIQTSDNVIVQALRREGRDIELRLVEARGRAGEAWVRVELPHVSAARTNLLGAAPVPLAGGPTYRLALRAQEIVTLRLRTETGVPPIVPLTDWTPLVPAAKRRALHDYDAAVKGHPPHG